MKARVWSKCVNRSGAETAVPLFVNLRISQGRVTQRKALPGGWAPGPQGPISSAAADATPPPSSRAVPTPLLYRKPNPAPGPRESGCALREQEPPRQIQPSRALESRERPRAGLPHTHARSWDAQAGCGRKRLREGRQGKGEGETQDDSSPWPHPQPRGPKNTESLEPLLPARNVRPRRSKGPAAGSSSSYF